MLRSVIWWVGGWVFLFIGKGGGGRFSLPGALLLREAREEKRAGEMVK